MATKGKVVPLSKWRLRRAIEFMDANLGKQTSLADIAAAVGLSKMYFAAQFRAATGSSPHDYLLLLRVRRAKALLSSTGLSLAEIALVVGFQAQAHFTSVFKRLTGETPKRWREAKIKETGEAPGLGRDRKSAEDWDTVLLSLVKEPEMIDWLPEMRQRDTPQSISLATVQIVYALGAAQLINVYAGFNPGSADKPRAALKFIDDKLADGRLWIAPAGPTIADVALYGYLMLAAKGSIEIDIYPNIKNWLQQIGALPGFTAFRKTMAGFAVAY